MSADMYSTNPTLMGSALIAAAPFAERFTDSASTETATVYGLVGAGIFLVCIALAITGSVGNMGAMMRFCSTVGALACAFAAWRFWPSAAFHPVSVGCLVAAAVLLLWGWGQPWWAGRARGG